MNYNLNEQIKDTDKKPSTWRSLQSLIAHMVEEKATLIKAFAAMVVAALFTLLGPLLIGYSIDHYIKEGNYHGLLVFGGLLLVMYLISMGAGYIQTRLMGTVGQRMLFALRNAIFNKVQDLPLDFFNQNKAGDLISRINNDTEKINQFFSHSLMQFVRSILVMTGAAIFLLSINLPLGAAALAPAVIIWFFTQLVSAWVKRRNAASLKSTGDLSAEVQESLANFKVVVAFNRRDYFRKQFEKVNQANYDAALKAGISNNVFMPVYSLFANVGQLVVLSFGIYLIAQGSFTVGFLISFLSYVTSFYNPLRQLASLWANFQMALAAWDRVLVILQMENNLPLKEQAAQAQGKAVLAFRDVRFAYPNGTEVLHQINFELEAGKTYAFVGPTGGGKTTTASLIARLYDPSAGEVYLQGKDIRAFTAAERTQKIGFILQEPFLFSGSIRDNILYGKADLQHLSSEELMRKLQAAGLDSLLERFDEGLETQVSTGSDGLSLGQQQLIAFMRAVMRQPDLLILDEATANIDTVTEKLLDDILEKLPRHTTKVIIAHRLNTIASADEIYFVNSGSLTRAGSLDDAVNMLMKGRKAS